MNPIALDAVLASVHHLLVFSLVVSFVAQVIVRRSSPGRGLAT